MNRGALRFGLWVGVIGVLGAQPPQSHQLVTQAEYERWQKELSNWGRWGKDDELGALNLITPAKRKQAAALVKEGFTVSLAPNANAKRKSIIPARWSGAC